MNMDTQEVLVFLTVSAAVLYLVKSMVWDSIMDARRSASAPLVPAKRLVRRGTDKPVVTPACH